MNRFSRNQLALISDSYKTSQRRIAREASRSDRPEDIMGRRVLYGIGVAIVALFSRVLRFFSFGWPRYKPVDHIDGFFGRSDLDNTAPKWFRALQKRHMYEIPYGHRRSRRLNHKYIARGYGYQTPDNVERLQKKSYKTRTATV